MKTIIIKYDFTAIYDIFINTYTHIRINHII